MAEYKSIVIGIATALRSSTTATAAAIAGCSTVELRSPRPHHTRCSRPVVRGAAVIRRSLRCQPLPVCHMLWFLSIAAKREFTVESYRDEAVGNHGKGLHRQVVP